MTTSLLKDFDEDLATFRMHRAAYMASLRADESAELFRKYPRHAHFNMASIAREDACDSLNRRRPKPAA